MVTGGVVGGSVCALLAMDLSAPSEKAPLSRLHLAAAPGQRSATGREREREERAPPLSEGVWDVGVHDMNGDARPDLVVATGGPGSDSGAISLLFNPGGEAPLASWDSVTLETRADYGRLAVGDIDGDGVNDVAALTFSTRVLRWWRLAADHSVLDERSISLTNAPLPGRQCAAPPAVTASSLTLSSLAFADLDVDHALELAITGYAGNGDGGLFLFSFQRQSGCFQLHRRFARRTRGSLKVRFFDVDGDESLDIVTSHYALTRPNPRVPGCSDCLEWGEWWSATSDFAAPLVARFGNPRLLAAQPVPELNVVDFDAIRTPDGVRYALAGSAHLCPAGDCWNEGQGGFVSVVEADGRELWSGDTWKREVERDAPVEGARLLPRVVSFGGQLARPYLAAGHWWATRRKDSPCSRIIGCAGPLTFGAIDEPWPVVEDESAFVQAVAFLGDDTTRLERRCSPPGPLVQLPELPVTAIVDVRIGARRLEPDGYSWVSGSAVVALAPEVAHGSDPVCITYTTSERQRLAVADSQRGLELVSLR